MDQQSTVPLALDCINSLEICTNLNSDPVFLGCLTSFHDKKTCVDNVIPNFNTSPVRYAEVSDSKVSHPIIAMKTSYLC